MVLFAIAELLLRSLGTASPAFARFVFLQEMSNERWDYLLDQERETMLSSLQEERIPTRHPNEEFTEEPELDRPPYDRLGVEFHVKKNAHGFRDPPFRPTRAPGRRRVLLLGDSIAYGKGLEPSQRLGDVWAALEPRLEVLNLAHPACGTVCQRTILEEFADFQADLVVIQPSGNDVDTTMGRAAAAALDSPLAAVVRLVMRSRVMQAVAYGLWGTAKAQQLDAALSATAEAYAPELERLFATCRRIGAQAVVIAFPGSNAVWYATHVADACRRHPEVCLGSVEVALEAPEQWLPDWPRSAEARDPGPPAWIRETAEGMDLSPTSLAEVFPLWRLFLDIVHPNALAHRVAALQLQDLLRRTGAVTPPPPAPPPPTSATPTPTPRPARPLP